MRRWLLLAAALLGLPGCPERVARPIRETIHPPPKGHRLKTTSARLAKTALAPGESTTLSLIVTNDSVNASGPFRIDVYASRAREVLLGSAQVANVSLRETPSVELTIRAPSSPGTYVGWIVLDDLSPRNPNWTANESDLPFTVR